MVFSYEKNLAEQVHSMLSASGAESRSEEIISCCVRDRTQYDMKAKNNIHYRLQRILKKMKNENPMQYRFLKSKVKLFYNLHTINLKELEEKLYLAENICSCKQERYIGFLTAAYGLKLKENVYVSKSVAQFLITGLKENKTEALEKYRHRFEEL